VGARLLGLLVAAGARVTVTDIRAEACERAAKEHGAAVVDPGELLSVEADIFAPCALGGVIHDVTVENLRVRAVAGSANNVLASPEHGQALFDRGVLYAPDFVINAGALLQGALCHLEGAAPPPERIRQIGQRVGQFLDEASRSGIPPEVVAERAARERVAAAPHDTCLPRRRRR
jgi:leucine dehydrogenase